MPEDVARPATRPTHRPPHRGSGVGLEVPLWLGVLLIPFVILVQFVTSPFVKKTKDRNAEEVAGFLRDFISGSGGEWDWDEFVSVPITDPKLEAIRKEAEMVGPGHSRADADFAEIAELLRRAEAVAAADRLSDRTAHTAP